MKQIIISIGILLILSTATLVVIRVSTGTDPFMSDPISPIDNGSRNNFPADGVQMGVQQMNSNSSNDPLYGDWVWAMTVDERGKITEPSDPSRFVLTLEPEGRLSSTTDCNALSGSFVKNGEVISVGPLVATVKGCMGETLESLYASQLERVSSYSIEGDVLTLVLIKDAGMMSFDRK